MGEFFLSDLDRKSIPTIYKESAAKKKIAIFYFQYVI